MLYDIMISMKKVIFSGIQPSGSLHIGNYIGAVQQWIKLQDEPDEKEIIFCIVDLHAITVPQDPKVLKENIRELVASWLACGIDPKKSNIFVQSENHDHSYLAWIFDCITPIGWMNRMTQFKDKSEKQKEWTSFGLFNYPALMAADILLYDTTLVPVGEDQVQHIELARDIAEKFNKKYKELFTIPSPVVDKKAARIRSLQNPEKKMSKSEVDPQGTINLLDNLDEVTKKVKKAVTDSGTHVSADKQTPALENLITIYAKFTNKSNEEAIKELDGKSYSEFKDKLAEAVVVGLKPIQEEYKRIRSDQKILDDVLQKGLEFTSSKSSKKVSEVTEAMGLGR